MNYSWNLQIRKLNENLRSRSLWSTKPVTNQQIFYCINFSLNHDKYFLFCAKHVGSKRDWMNILKSWLHEGWFLALSSRFQNSIVSIDWADVLHSTKTALDNDCIVIRLTFSLRDLHQFRTINCTSANTSRSMSFGLPLTTQSLLYW